VGHRTPSGTARPAPLTAATQCVRRGIGRPCRAWSWIVFGPAAPTHRPEPAVAITLLS
jgi:hypothetical protein